MSDESENESDTALEFGFCESVDGLVHVHLGDTTLHMTWMDALVASCQLYSLACASATVAGVDDDLFESRAREVSSAVQEEFIRAFDNPS